jgi:hypothetical protein
MSITCSSSGGDTQASLGILCVCVLCQLAAQALKWNFNPRAVNWHKLNKKCGMLVSLYWYIMMHGQQNFKLMMSLYICEMFWFWNTNPILTIVYINVGYTLVCQMQFIGINMNKNHVFLS